MAQKKTTGLGRGLEGLIPQNFDSSLLTDESERVQKLFITDIIPSSQQPRRHFEQDSLNELASSIKRHGILQPIIVRHVENDKYEIIAGERRWRAARLAGLESLPAIVRSLEELERLEIALIENVQRVDLSPLEQAASIMRLRDQFNIEYTQIAERLGKAHSTVVNIVRLLGLPAEAQKALHEKRITEGHARAILALKDKAKQLELLNFIQRNNWTVRQAEQYVTAQKAGVENTQKAQERVQATTPETKELAKVLKASVTLRRTARGGKLEIAFKDDKDLSRIIKKMGK
jgi:ParB family chromosome partitioning protein